MSLFRATVAAASLVCVLAAPALAKAPLAYIHVVPANGTASTPHWIAGAAPFMLKPVAVEPQPVVHIPPPPTVQPIAVEPQPVVPSVPVYVPPTAVEPQPIVTHPFPSVP